MLASVSLWCSGWVQRCHFSGLVIFHGRVLGGVGCWRVCNSEEGKDESGGRLVDDNNGGGDQ